MSRRLLNRLLSCRYDINSVYVTLKINKEGCDVLWLNQFTLALIYLGRYLLKNALLAIEG